MAVDRTWRTLDRQWLVDQVVDEPGVEYRVWDAEGASVGEATGPEDLRQLLVELGVDQNQLERVPTDDPWCEGPVCPGHGLFAVSLTGGPPP